MEVLRRITGINAQKEQDLKDQEFQKKCRELAVGLFGLLRKYDPWCIFVEFKGPPPLNPDNPDASGTIFALTQCASYREQGPFVDYQSFVITVPVEKGFPLERVELRKRYGYRVATWDLITEVNVPGETVPLKRWETNSYVLDKIQQSIQKWRCMPTKK